MNEVAAAIEVDEHANSDGGIDSTYYDIEAMARRVNSRCVRVCCKSFTSPLSSLVRMQDHSDSDFDELAATAASQNVLRVGVRGRLMDSLPALQNAIKRDAESYKEEFRQQFNHFQAQLGIFKLQPARAPKQAKAFSDLITFVSHVAPCYPEHCKEFPTQLLELLDSHAATLDADLRRSIVQALVLLRNRDFLSPLALMPALFQLFKCQDKALRTLVFQHIIGDISRVNAKHKNNKLNTSLQNYLYSVLQDTESPTAVKKSLDVMVELYKRNVWRDAKTVNVISTACFSKQFKVVATALRFFLGVTTAEDEDDHEADKGVAIKQLLADAASMQNSKHKKKRQRKLDRSVDKIKREEREREEKNILGSSDVGAIRLVYDPTSFTEKLFRSLTTGGHPFDLKLLLMNTISRFIGCHKLFILNFYPHLQKYMQPSQKNVTAILVYLAQASHELVPPDVLEPCIRTLANHFVTERCSGEVMCVGLNAVRELCSRQPLAMDATLLQDLAQYKTHRDKGVVMAARSLIALFRDRAPELLHRRDRGKLAVMSMSRSANEQHFFGEQSVSTDVMGAQYLVSEDKEDAENQDEWNKSDEGSGSDDSDEDVDLSDLSDVDEDDEDDEENAGSDAESGDKKKKHRMRKMAESDSESSDDEVDADADDEDMMSEKKLRKKRQREAQKQKAKELAALVDGVDAARQAHMSVDDAAAPTGGSKKRKAEAELDRDEEEEGDEEDDEDEADEEDGDDEELSVDESGDEMSDVDGDSQDDNSDDQDEEDDSDEDEEDEDEDEEMAEHSSSSRPLPLASMKIFTPKDFEMMKMASARAAAAAAKGKGRFQTDKTERSAANTDGDEVLDALTIEGYHGKKRAEYAERLASTITGRNEFKSKAKNGGSTNEEKKRKKNFQMIKHTHQVRRKAKRSVSRRASVRKGVKAHKAAAAIKHKQKKRRF